MLFKQFQHEEGACLSYIIGCTRTDVAAVVEPQLDITPYLHYLNEHNLKLTKIFETHAQADHLSGAQRLSEATGATVHYHESAKPNFPVQRVRDGDEVLVGNIRLTVLHTPGHTADSICLAVADTTRSEEPWFLLTGDTLFVGDVGRPDLHGSAEALYDSVYDKLLK
ncbi:MAG: MBL fold metallo-hydrolase, partial [Bacteroidota bacterium]